MHIEIRPYCDGWAWFLVDPKQGPEAIASSRPYITRHAAAESARRLMMDGVDEIADFAAPSLSIPARRDRH